MTLEGINSMYVNKLGIAAVCFMVLAGCASKGDFEVMQRDMDELKNRHLSLEKDFGGLKNETREGTDKALKENQKEIEALHKEAADLQAALDSAKVDMQVLAGKVDDAMQTAKKPAEDISLLKEDLDRRLTALEGRTGKVEKSFEELDKKSAETAAKQAELSPEALYQQGLTMFKGGNSQKARELFAKFIEQYPNHELAANAHYWLGETYYTEKIYDQAVLEFEKVIKNYPGKEKAPAAMLKQAMAFKALGDVTSAKYVLNKLIESHPHSEEAGLAKAKLKELK
jgi:tol-pal system protein YbgF